MGEVVEGAGGVQLRGKGCGQVGGMSLILEVQLRRKGGTGVAKV